MELTALCIIWGGYLLGLYLVIFWLLVLFRERVGAAEHAPDQREDILQSLPLVTVAIPAWNEAANIRQTMESALALDYPHNRLELIVVNDGSSDETETRARRVAKDNSDRSISVLNQPNRGKGAALNTALRSAKGEFFVPMDADSLIREDALKKMMPRFKDPGIAAVLPLMKVREPSNLLQKIQWCEYLVSAFYKRLMAVLDCISIIPGPFSIYRTQVLLELGGFDEKNITEDVELTLRLQHHHYKIAQVFDTEVCTTAPATWRHFRRQRNRWYKGTLLNAWHYRRMAFNSAYGDFGFVQMPRLMIECGLLLTLTWAVFYLFVWKPLKVQLNIFWLTEFDLTDFLLNGIPDSHFLDINWTIGFFIAVGYALSVFLVTSAHRFAHEPVARQGYFAVLAFVFLYPPLITVVYIGVFADLVRHKVREW